MLAQTIEKTTNTPSSSNLIISLSIAPVFVLPSLGIQIKLYSICSHDSGIRPHYFFDRNYYTEKLLHVFLEIFPTYCFTWHRMKKIVIFFDLGLFLSTSLLCLLLKTFVDYDYLFWCQMGSKGQSWLHVPACWPRYWLL